MIDTFAIREIHGMGAIATASLGPECLTLREGEKMVHIDRPLTDLQMTPDQARYLASRLLRIARRIDERHA